MDTELSQPSDPASLRCNGLLVIDKPAGITSRDCVNAIERLLRPAFPKPAALPKVGHAGTLDPLATGVLVIGIGAGVRLVPYIQQMQKTYHAHFRLGAESDTGDVEGIVVEEQSPTEPSFEQLQLAAKNLTGFVQQVPPATSAIRVNGRKAYTYAHRGEAVVVPPRTVWIESIELCRYQYPTIECTVVCGSGTYIRTLGQDLAKLAHTTAVMTALRRTAIGCFTLTHAVTLDSLDLTMLCNQLRPLAWGVEQLPQLSCNAEALRRFDLGQKILANELPSLSVKDAQATGNVDAIEPLEAKVLDESGRLAAIVQLKDGRWCPYRVFPA